MFSRKTRTEGKESDERDQKARQQEEGRVYSEAMTDACAHAREWERLIRDRHRHASSDSVSRSLDTSLARSCGANA